MVYHKNEPNVGKYTIHGSLGVYSKPSFFSRCVDRHTGSRKASLTAHLNYTNKNNQHGNLGPTLQEKAGLIELRETKGTPRKLPPQEIRPY